jgi:hypothetical protein
MDELWVLPELIKINIPSDCFFYVITVVMIGLLVASLHPPTRRLLSLNLQRAWLLLRQVLGWLLIIIGILGMILPGPGIPFFVLGVLLVGRRHHLLRRSSVLLRLHLRRLGRRPGIIGRGAQLARQQFHRVRTHVRPLFRKFDPRHRHQGDHRD